MIPHAVSHVRTDGVSSFAVCFVGEGDLSSASSERGGGVSVLKDLSRTRSNSSDVEVPIEELPSPGAARPMTNTAWARHSSRSRTLQQPTASCRAHRTPASVSTSREVTDSVRTAWRRWTSCDSGTTTVISSTTTKTWPGPRGSGIHRGRRRDQFDIMAIKR